MQEILTGNNNASDFSKRLLQIGSGSMTLNKNDGLIKLDAIANEVKIHKDNNRI